MNRREADNDPQLTASMDREDDLRVWKTISIHKELLQMNDARWKQTSRFEIVAKSFARLIHNLT